MFYRVRKDPRKDPRNAIELQRLIRWLEVTEVIEPQSSYHTQFVSKWDACEMRRETGGFEDDDTDLSPIEGNRNVNSNRNGYSQLISIGCLIHSCQT